MAGWLVDPLTGRSAECATGCDHRMTGLRSRRRATCTFTPKDQVGAAGGELHTRKQGNEESVREFHEAADVPGGIGTWTGHQKGRGSCRQTDHDGAGGVWSVPPALPPLPPLPSDEAAERTGHCFPPCAFTTELPRSQ